MGEVTTGALSVLTRGHYRIRVPEIDGPIPLLVGFHGYAQNAEEHLEDLMRIPGSEHWAICAAQGLHLFYRRVDRVVGASWMTRFGREESMVDNLAYIARLVATLRERFDLVGPLVYAGFSQGVAMAYRAAAGSGHKSQAVLALAGDVPPELRAEDLASMGLVLIGCGSSDKLYGETRMASDVARLRESGTRFECCLFDGGHEWHSDYLARSAEVLGRVWRQWHPASKEGIELAVPITIEDGVRSDEVKGNQERKRSPC